MKNFLKTTAMPVLSLLLAGSVLYGCYQVVAQTQKTAPPAPNAKPNAARPNIIVILADDLGYGDISAYPNKEIPTPNLEKLAKSGVLCTQGYASAPVCCPSRAGLLTGRHQQRFGMEFNLGPAKRDWENSYGMDVKQITIADALHKAGYTTHMIGKWHQGSRPQFHPKRRGFDSFVGILGGATLYINPDAEGVETGSVEGEEARKTRGAYKVVRDTTILNNENEYLTEFWAKEANAVLDQQKQADKPFFMYMAFTAPHSPLQATKKYLDRFSTIKDKNRRIYCAMVSALDDAVGSIMAKLKDTGLDKNTLVVFASDNGCATYTRACSPNSPLKGGKLSHWEGGFREPYIWSFPGKLPQGVVFDKVCSLMDVFPTAVTLAGGEVPKDRPMDGVDLMPYLMGKNKTTPHEVLYWRNAFFKTLRQGNYKLYRSVKEDQTFTLLFDLTKDPTETTNLADKMPDKVKAMIELYDKWDKQMESPRWPSKGYIKFENGGMDMWLPV